MDLLLAFLLFSTFSVIFVCSFAVLAVICLIFGVWLWWGVALAAVIAAIGTFIWQRAGDTA